MCPVQDNPDRGQQPAHPGAGLTTLGGRLLATLRSAYVIYAFATAFSALGALLLTRVLWLRLSAEDFGSWVLADAVLLVIVPALLLGTDHSLIKQVRLDKQPVGKVMGVLVSGCLPPLVIGGLIVGAFSAKLDSEWGLALTCAIVAEALLVLVQAAFRAADRALCFAFLLVARTYGYVLLLVTSPLLLGDPQLTLSDVFLLRAGWVAGLSVLGLMALRPELSFDLQVWRRALRYGFPLLLAITIHAAADLADRVALGWYVGSAAVGIYALHLKLASILSQAVVVPFGLWFPPERLRHMEDSDGGRNFFLTVADTLLALCLLLGGTLWLCREPLLTIIAPGSEVSPMLLGLCIVATLCLALGQVFNVGLMLPGQTRHNATCMLAAALAAAGAAVALVPLLETTGAGLARLAGGVVFVVVTAAWSYRAYPVSYPFLRMSLQAALTVMSLVVLEAILSGADKLVPRLLFWVPAATTLVLFPFLFRRHATPRHGSPAASCPMEHVP
jgi:O-antigen/teichoic acid export membrane protein